MIALRGSAAVPTGNPTTGFTVSIPSAVLADDLLFLSLTSRDSTGAGTLAVTDNDTGGNAWTKIANSTDHKATLWYKRATATTASKTVTVANAVGSASGVLKCFSGGSRGATPYSNIVVETNASGNETHAGFTPATPNAMLCASVHNYANDNAVTSLAFASSGATAATEKLSTGGSDSGCIFGHVLQSGSPAATGNLTWAQTDGTTYSITWAIIPNLEASLSATLGDATASAQASVDVAASTDAALDAATLEASGTVEGGGISADLDVTLGALTVAGATGVAIAAASSPTLSALTADGESSLDVSGAASLTLGMATAESAVDVAVMADLVFALGEFVASSDAGVEIAAAALIDMAAAEVQATAAASVNGDASIALDDAELSGDGVVGDPPVEAFLDLTLSSLTCQGEGVTPIAASLAALFGASTSEAFGAVSVLGSSAFALLALSSDGNVDNGEDDGADAEEPISTGLAVASMATCRQKQASIAHVGLRTST